LKQNLNRIFEFKIYEKMKKIGVLLILTVILATISSATMAQQKELRHVVMFKFKDGASAADIKKVEDAFRALPSKIKEIKSLEWGTNNSPENLAQGFTHCFFLSFSSEADRAIYLPHPDHKAFGAVLGPVLDKVLVLDYWAAK
jgi:Stress responsive A/B Barrel Domain